MEKDPFFFSDERVVPKDHPDSNYGMVKQILFDKIDIPECNIHPMYSEYAELKSACSDYGDKLSSILEKNRQGIPVIDFSLLGIGTDGHTASIFPGTSALAEQTNWVAPVYVAKLDSCRITLTFPILTSSKKIIFLVSGTSKQDVLKGVLNNDDIEYPVKIIARQKETHWFLDAATFNF